MVGPQMIAPGELVRARDSFVVTATQSPGRLLNSNKVTGRLLESHLALVVSRLSGFDIPANDVCTDTDGHPQDELLVVFNGPSVGWVAANEVWAIR